MREAILDTAADLFADASVDDITLDHVATNVGITSQHLRLYYTSPVAIERELRTHPARGRW